MTNENVWNAFKAIWNYFYHLWVNPASYSPCSPTLDVTAPYKRVACAGRDSLGAVLQWLDQHLLESADLLEVSQNQGHIGAAKSGGETIYLLPSKLSQVILDVFIVYKNVTSYTTITQKQEVLLVDVLKRSQVVRQETLKVFGKFGLSF